MWEVFENFQAQWRAKPADTATTPPADTKEQAHTVELAGLLKPEVAGQTVFLDLDEMIEMAFISRPAAVYGAHLLLGGKQYKEVLPELTYGEGVWQALQSIVQVKIGGSQVTRALATRLLGSEQVVGTRDTPTKLLLALESLFNRTALRTKPTPPRLRTDAESYAGLIESYYDDAIDVTKLKKFDYFALHLLLNLEGSNFDFKLYDKQQHLKRTLEQVTAIIRMMFAYPVDGGQRRIVSTNHFNRFQTLHLFDRMASGGQINIAVMDPQIKNDWANATNWRQGTNLTLEENDETGHLGVRVPLAPFTEPLTLLLHPGTYDTWALHAARSIRIITTHKLNEKHIDVQSFMDKLPPKNQSSHWNFESIVGTTSNLLLAFFEDPATTLTLLKKLQWFEPNDQDKLAILEKLAALLQTKLFTQVNSQSSSTPQHDWFRVSEDTVNQSQDDQPDLPTFAEQIQTIIAEHPVIMTFATELQEAENNLWQKPNPTEKNSFYFPTDVDFDSLSFLAPFLFALCPVGLEELDAAIPATNKREQIEVTVSGSSALNTGDPENTFLDRKGRNHTQTAANAGRAMRQISYRVAMQARHAFNKNQPELAQILLQTSAKIAHDARAIENFLLPVSKSYARNWQKKQRTYLIGNHFVWK